MLYPRFAALRVRDAVLATRWCLWSACSMCSPRTWSSSASTRASCRVTLLAPSQQLPLDRRRHHSAVVAWNVGMSGVCATVGVTRAESSFITSSAPAAFSSSPSPSFESTSHSQALILGVETSCDETAAAVVSTTGEVRSQVLRSQWESLREHGGVFPEMAKRQHQQSIDAVIQSALAEVRSLVLILVLVLAFSFLCC
jgi:tRNA N6-adenosine threonylcarbamoyltransferase